MRKLVIIVLIVAAVAAYLTNPSNDQHREASKQRINQLMQTSMGKDNPVFGSIGATVGTMLAGPVLDNVINSNNYYLFSTTTLTWNGVTNAVGTGVFGRIFLGDKFDQAYKNMIGGYKEGN